MCLVFKVYNLNVYCNGNVCMGSTMTIALLFNYNTYVESGCNK